MMRKVFSRSNRKKLSQLSADEDSFVESQERPKIYLIDIDTNAEEALTTAGFNCIAGSLGSLINLPNAQFQDRCVCRVRLDIPPNLHEFDIIVIDLKDREPIDYDESRHNPPGGKSTRQLLFYCEFPQTIFDPRPFAGFLIHPTIQEIQRKESIVLVFATARDEFTYHSVRVTLNSYVPEDSFKYDNFSFLPSRPATDNKIGLETKVVRGENNEFRYFLQKHNDEFVYKIIFHHPEEWNGSQMVKSPNFFPLIVNSADEIVSYAEIDGSSILFMLPQLEDKSLFLLELFQEHLPTIIPRLFPFSSRFAWLNDEEYLLPNEAKLLTEKRLLEQEYSERIETKEREIEDNYQQYKFLHDLLTETGAKLVKAVEQFFHWLGFDNVVNCDEAYPGRNEEDLRVSLDNGLLVVEVKGIGGTSKDEDCSQISKIRYRRVKERDSLDVFALYIVNHQRYLPPENRSNPPFTGTQIEDAKNDERGLLTTYDLFKLYFDVSSGFITKEDARESLLDFGLVAFRPSNSVLIGRPLEIHYNGTVGIFLLQDVTIRSGEELLVREDGQYRKVEVIGLQDRDRDVAEASEGEIGIRFSDKISQKSELWKTGG
jgi:hypothetical protein